MSASRFDVAAFLVASARDGLEAPPVYGALRMLEAVARLDDATDPFLRRLRDRIEADKDLVMRDRGAFVTRLDELLADVAREAATRNGSPAEPAPSLPNKGA